MLGVENIGAPQGSCKSEDEANIEPHDERDEQCAGKKGRPETFLGKVAEADPDGGGAEKQPIKQKQAGAKDERLVKGMLKRKGVSGNHFFPSVNFCVRKSTWFLIFLSTLILCSITSDA